MCDSLNTVAFSEIENTYGIIALYIGNIKFIAKKAFKENTDNFCSKFIPTNHQSCELG